MNNEWQDLPNMEAVCEANVAGWEIEKFDQFYGNWNLWSEETWATFEKYRGRPKQPVKRKFLCYATPHRLEWRDEGFGIEPGWIRAPEHDKEV
jgi:hypothetical protein